MKIKERIILRKTRFLLFGMMLLFAPALLAEGEQQTTGPTVPTDLPTAVDAAHSVRANPGALGRWNEHTISFDYATAPAEEPLHPIAMGLQITAPLWKNAGWGADLYHYSSGAMDAALSFGFVGQNTEFGISWRFGIKPLQRPDEGPSDDDDGDNGDNDVRFGHPNIPDGTRFDVTLMHNYGSWLRLFFAGRNLGDAGTEDPSVEAGLGLRPFGGSFQMHWNSRFKTNKETFNDAWISSELLFRKDHASGLTTDLGLSMGDTNYIDESVVLTWFARIGFNFGRGGLYEPFGMALGDLSGSDYVAGMRMTYGQEARPSLVSPSSKALLIELAELGDEAPPKPLFGERKASFGESIAALMHHSERSDISTLVLRFDGSQLGWAQADDLRAVIAHYQAKQKEVIALIRVAGPTEIYLASAADTVIMDPAGAIMFQGLYRSIRFLAPGLKRLGISFQTVRHAEYKSFPEIFTRGEPSPEFLEATNRNLDVISETVRAALAQRENISAEGAQAILDGGPFSAESALRCGLVDQILPLEDLHKRKESPLKMMKIERLSLPALRVPEQWNPRDKIALIVVDGTIVRGSSGSNPFSKERKSGDISVNKALEEAANGPYSAVVVRIDSPGGDAIASESMARALKKLHDKKPVIISFGNKAASGGYMFATGDKVPILATPLTITGSIGVFALKVVYRELTDDLGLPLTALGRGKRAGIFSPDRLWSEEEEEELRTLLGSVYVRFVTSVAWARGKSYDELEPDCRGRVWMGKDALDKGLLDSIGGLPEALEQARVLGGFEDHTDYILEYIPTRVDFLKNLFGGSESEGNKEQAINQLAHALGLDTLSWALLSPPGSALARMPDLGGTLAP